MTLTLPAYLLTMPADVVNEGIDMLGETGQIIGDVTDGTPVATAARRNYGQALRRLLRTAHWDFARKRATLQLLGDATGQSPSYISTIVESPWLYAYAWPLDAEQGRWLPWTPDNLQPVSGTGVPLTTGPANVPVNPMLQPARFLVGSSDQYPVQVGVQPWDQQPDLRRTEGVGPSSRKIILTDCAQAEFVYTRLVTVIEEWDRLFRLCMAEMMAIAVAPAAIQNPKEREAVIARITGSLKMHVADARVANGNESGMPQSVDHQPNWITARNRGWWGAAPADGGSILTGYTYMPWDASMQWGGSVF